MRIPIDQITPDRLLTIPNLLLHPDVAKFGISRYTFNHWRVEKNKDGTPKLVTVNDCNGENQKIYKTTLVWILEAIHRNLGINTEKEILQSRGEEK